MVFKGYLYTVNTQTLKGAHSLLWVVHKQSESCVSCACVVAIFWLVHLGQLASYNLELGCYVQ